MNPQQPTEGPRRIHPLVDLYVGDSLRVLDAIPSQSVDAVVCDPPYAIKNVPDPLDAYRASDPGREVDPCVTCGNHTHTPGLTICKPCADNCEKDAFAAAAMLGQHSANWHEKATHSRGYADNNNSMFARWVALWATECVRVLKPGGHLVAFGGTKTWHRLATGIEDAGFDFRDSLAWVYATGTPKSLDVAAVVAKHRDRQSASPSPRTEELGPRHHASGTPKPDQTTPDWQGWGTALKPAHEPIVLARKPVHGTVAANVDQYGVGGLNIDATRLEDGRWPSNLFLDTHQAVVLDDAASQRASRFFWVAKPSQHERVHVDGVSHPTVKPLQLMRELIRLVTPPGGVVLDPFAGSGTTAEAAVLEGMRCVVIEKDPRYVPLIEHRLGRRRPSMDVRHASRSDDTGPNAVTSPHGTLF